MMSANKDLVNSQCRYFGYPMETAIRLGYIHTVRVLAETGAEIYNENIFSFHRAITKLLEVGMPKSLIIFFTSESRS
jgi:hypothetical protein